MKYFIYIVSVTILTFFTQCDTLRSLPTNTSGAFSLNGNWEMTSTTDNTAMVGTIVTVIPAVSNGTVRSFSNNNYCVRERDVMWRNIVPLEAGTFNIENLVNACDSAVYRPATITMVTNDEVKVTGNTVGSVGLVQTFKRVNVQ